MEAFESESGLPEQATGTVTQAEVETEVEPEVELEVETEVDVRPEDEAPMSHEPDMTDAELLERQEQRYDEDWGGLETDEETVDTLDDRSPPRIETITGPSSSTPPPPEPEQTAQSEAAAQAVDPLPLGVEGNWMPGGPRSSKLIPSYPHHYAARVWQATQALVEGRATDVAGVVFPSLATVHPIERVLRTFPRPQHYDIAHTYRTNEEGGWWALVRASRLTSVEPIDFRRVDRVMISAFIERWYPETNSFHFPWGEMTITLHDVVRILDIPIDGASVVRHVTVEEAHEQLVAIMGVEDAEELVCMLKRGGNFSVQEHLKKRLEKLCKENPRNEQHIATLYLAILVTSKLFGDMSGSLVKWEWVTMFFDHEQTGNYAWGAGVLAYLYRQFGLASRGLTPGVCGPTLLLRSWIWAYFPRLRGHMSSKADDLRAPTAARQQGRQPALPIDERRLIDLRQLLDHYTPSDVCWQPWGVLDFEDPLLRPSRYRGILELNVIVDGVIQEQYLPDRVLRQFGRTQGVPDDPPAPDTCERNSQPRPKVVLTYPERMLQWDVDTWPLLELGQRHTHPYCTPEYQDWWAQMSHPYVDYRSRHGGPPLPPDWSRVSLDCSAQLRELLVSPPSQLVELSPEWIVALTHIADQLSGDVPLRTPPMPRRVGTET